MNPMLELTGSDRLTLRAMVDRLVPPVGNLPGAGGLGLLDALVEGATRHPPYAVAITALLDALESEGSTPGFDDLDPARQDGAIRRMEAGDPISFNGLLELVYIVYYSHPDVHRRIGWRTGPLQPRGFDLPPFDDAILTKARTREPFWREVP